MIDSAPDPRPAEPATGVAHVGQRRPQAAADAEPATEPRRPLDAERPPDRSRAPRGWVIALVVLALLLLGSTIVLVQVARPPSYEPVPIPSVSST